jgi:hypothetical protein
MPPEGGEGAFCNNVRLSRNFNRWDRTIDMRQ